MKLTKKTVFILLIVFMGLMLSIPDDVMAVAPTMTPAGGTYSSPTSLASGQVGIAYGDMITASGCGSGNYSWSRIGGSLPPGLSWSTGGTSQSILIISGTPTTAGTYKVRFRVSRSGCSPSSTSGWYSITINPTTALDITTTSLPNGIKDTAYSETITATGGTEIGISWSVISGTLPPGLSLAASATLSTTLSGTPTTVGTYTFTVRVTDSLYTDSQEYTVEIGIIQIITTSPLTSGTEGTAYSTTITGAGGSGSYTWSVSDGLPPGLALASSGTPSTTLSGTPTAGGTYTFTITLTDGTNLATKEFSLTINYSNLSIDTITLSPSSTAVCTSYSATITGSGGTTPYSWDITAGSLPSGLSLNASGTPSTTISGIPTSSGTSTFTVKLTDNNGISRIQTYSIQVTGSAICAPVIDDYTAYPPFIQLSGVKPNVLLVVDNSGSMYEFAYKTAGKGGSRTNADDSYAYGTTYYGYFQSGTYYSYETTGGGSFYANSGGAWDGDFLNWLTMRRVDVVRKVLVGGKATPRSQTQVNYLIAAEDPDRDYWKRVNTQYYKISGVSSYEQIQVCSTSACTSYSATYNVRVKVNYEVPIGLLHDNIDQMRFGLMFFNVGNKFEGTSSSKDGGYVAQKIDSGDNHLTSLVTDISNTDPSTWTPLGESMYESIRFYQNGWSAYNGGNYGEAFDPIEEACQDNFVLILTDGESTKDRNLPGGYWGSPTVSDANFNVKTYMDNIATNEGYSSQWSTNANTSEGTYYLEGVAYYAHTNDLISDFSGEQNITTYTVFAFDESPIGRDLLRKTAKYGGFEDNDGNGKPYTDSTCGTASPNPYCSEWDRDNDGVPDTYFEAQEGSELESELNKALTDILRRTASGTSASVLATTGEGEGAVYQAYFLPSKIEGATEVEWLGYLHGLFVDKYGNMREDTDSDRKLCYGSGNPSGCTSTDKIIQMYYDETVVPNRTRIKLYPGTIDSNGNPTGTYTIVDFDAMKTIWEGGKSLWSRDISSSPRDIKTTIDGTDFIPFTTAYKSSLRPYLRASSDNEAEAIIKFISGEDDPVVNSTTYDYRTRAVSVDLNGDGDTSDVGESAKVWKLGDIVYSTPVAVARPSENYSSIYRDLTYATFLTKYNNRRYVVYAGANDGMLHAFNGGFYDSSTLKFWKNYSGGSFSDVSSYEMGDELWAFIPQSLLPHLKWLTDNDYTHVYYVDSKPKVVDARIFTAEAICASDTNDSACVHPYGWGTVLIGGMRFGGRDISFQDATWTAQRTFRSAYFALDITDPLNPDLLWTIPVTSSDYPNGTVDLGLTTVYPAVLRVGDTVTGVGTWYTVFGSGPDAGTDSYKGMSERYGSIYIVNLATGAIAKTFTVAENYSFMSDPITIDADLNDKVDIIYIGDIYCQASASCTSSNWKGKMFRISTNKGDSDTTNWALSTLYNPAQPISAAPAVSMDNKGNLWIYFGTGRYYYIDDEDLDSTESWSFYGIKDVCKPWLDASCTTEILKTSLFNATNVQVFTDESVTGSGITDVDTFSEMVAEVDRSSNNGWYLDFSSAGERSLYKPGIIGGIVFWTTYLPSSDTCYLGGSSKLYAAYYKTGTAYKQSVIGLSGTQVLRDITLGRGMPSSIGFSVTSSGESTAMGFVQQSTGAILQVEVTTPSKPKSGIAGWRADCD